MQCVGVPTVARRTDLNIAAGRVSKNEWIQWWYTYCEFPLMRECPFLWVDVLEVLLNFMLLQNVLAYV